MDEQDDIIEIDNLTDLELISLYNKVLEHLKFLDSSILEQEGGDSNNE